MAVAAYSAWTRAGRPVTPAQPVREIVTRMKAAFPAASSTFGWYANEAHYQANPPEDHTPFSATGWPLPSPQWFVFATDIMHNPGLGVDCNVLFSYWISEARAGRMPWLKYLIWQAKIYDVRNGWRPQSNSGHFDHIHISARTDFLNGGLGSWSLVPGQPKELTDMPLVFKAVPTGRVGVTGGAGWTHIADPKRMGSVRYVIELNGGKWPDPLPEVPDAELDSGGLFGPQVQAVTVDTAAIAAAVVAAIEVHLPADSLSRDELEAAVREAIDGATVTSTIETAG